MFDEPEETGSRAGGPANKSGGARDRAQPSWADQNYRRFTRPVSSTALAGELSKQVGELWQRFR